MPLKIALQDTVSAQFEKTMAYQNVCAYIENHFLHTLPPKPELTHSLLHLLALEPSLKSISQIPDQLKILCVFWEQRGESINASSPGATLTLIYTELVLMLINRIDRQGKSLLTSTAEVFDCYKNEITVLGKLAFEMMQLQQVLMPAEKFKENINGYIREDSQFLRSIFDVGVLRTLDSSSPLLNQLNPQTVSDTQADLPSVISDDRKEEQSLAQEDSITKTQCYRFNNFTTQEYFAAWHLVNCLKQPIMSPECQEAYHFIRTKKYDIYYNTVIAFTAGFLSQQRLEEGKVASQQFWGAIDASPRDLLGLCHLDLLLRCLTEAQVDVDARELILSPKKLSTWILKAVEVPKNNKYRNYLLTASQLVTTHHKIIISLLPPAILERLDVLKLFGNVITHHPSIVDKVLAQLLNNDKTVQRDALDVLRLGSAGLMSHPRVVEHVLAQLDDTNVDIQCAALDDLQQVGPELVKFPGAIDKILSLVEHNKCDDIISRAWSVLKSLGSSFEHPVIIDRVNRILTLTQQQRERGDTLLPLDLIAKALLKLKSPFNTFMTLLVGRDYHLGCGMFRAKSMQDERIIDVMLSALKNNLPSVQHAALNILKLEGTELRYPSAIAKILIELEREDGTVRKVACDMLASIGVDLSKYPSTIDKLLAQLEGCSLYVMTTFPQHLKKYCDSYILIDNVLYYVGRFGSSEVVKIDDFDRFIKMLDGLKSHAAATITDYDKIVNILGFYKNKDNKIRLSNEQVNELITLNGGHAHTEDAGPILSGDVFYIFKSMGDKLLQYPKVVDKLFSLLEIEGNVQFSLQVGALDVLSSLGTTLAQYPNAMDNLLKIFLKKCSFMTQIAIRSTMRMIADRSDLNLDQIDRSVEYIEKYSWMDRSRVLGLLTSLHAGFVPSTEDIENIQKRLNELKGLERSIQGHAIIVLEYAGITRYPVLVEKILAELGHMRRNVREVAKMLGDTSAMTFQALNSYKPVAQSVRVGDDIVIYPELMDNVLVWLGSENSAIQTAVLVGLRLCGLKAVLRYPDILNKVLSCLDNANENIRILALNVLQTVGVALVQHPTVVAKVLTQLGGGWRIEKAACNVLLSLGTESLVQSRDVISTLLTQLDDLYYWRTGEVKNVLVNIPLYSFLSQSHLIEESYFTKNLILIMFLQQVNIYQEGKNSFFFIGDDLSVSRILTTSAQSQQIFTACRLLAEELNLDFLTPPKNDQASLPDAYSTANQSCLFSRITRQECESFDEVEQKNTCSYGSSM